MSRASPEPRLTGSATNRDASELDTDELVRYGRHLGLTEVGEQGQRRLKAARVLIVGAGGLGSPAALYLAAAGIGCIGVVDFDRVEASNLQRQLLHDTGRIGWRKTDSAKARLHEVNPLIHVETYAQELTSENALAIIGDYDVVVDGTDNFKTRYLTNDACVLLGRPNVYGSVLRFEGQASVFATPDGPCYRCLFREPPPPGLVPTCAEAGVLGVLPGLVGTIQATEAIKLILGIGETLSGRLLLVDALRMKFRSIALRRDPACPACGTRELTTLIDYDAFCGTSASHAPPAPMPSAREITPEQVAPRLRSGAIHLVDVREPFEWRIARLEGAQLIPLGEVPARLAEIPRDRDVVVYCHHGSRSRMVVDFLARNGYTRVWNLTGGIARWSADVDPTLPTY